MTPLSPPTSSTSVRTPYPEPIFHRRRYRGFTLVEILFSIGILSIGLIAVASLFPAAAIMQREAVRDALQQQDMRSAEGLFKGRGVDASTVFRFTEGLFTTTVAGAPQTGTDFLGANLARTQVSGGQRQALTGIDDLSGEVFAFSEVDRFTPGQDADNDDYPDMRLDNGSGVPFGGSTSYDDPGAYGGAGPGGVQSLLSEWPIEERSLPTFLPSLEQRERFIVPLIRRGEQANEFISDWQVYNFVLQRQRSSEGAAGAPIGRYPALPAMLAGGDGTLAVAANPFDDPRFVPKVFRLPIGELTAPSATNPAGVYEFTEGFDNLVAYPDGRGLLLYPGDLTLGNNGVVYRVTSIENDDANVFGLTPLNRQLGGVDASSNSLVALWVGVRPAAFSGPVVQDIRLLSRSVVRTRGL